MCHCKTLPAQGVCEAVALATTNFQEFSNSKAWTTLRPQAVMELVGKAKWRASSMSETLEEVSHRWACDQEVCNLRTLLEEAHYAKTATEKGQASNLAFTLNLSAFCDGVWRCLEQVKGDNAELEGGAYRTMRQRLDAAELRPIELERQILSIEKRHLEQKVELEQEHGRQLQHISDSHAKCAQELLVERQRCEEMHATLHDLVQGLQKTQLDAGEAIAAAKQRLRQHI